MIDWVAGAVSACGLYGIYHKRAWGPLVCGVASTVWCGIALSELRFPWASIEACWAISGYVTAWKWHADGD